MGIPTGVSDLKRVGVGEDYSKRQRLGSVELPQLSTNLGSLPLEMLEEVATHLKEREDLKSFSEISYLTKGAALREINIQNESLAVSELQVLSDLNPSKPDQESSLIGFYKWFLVFLDDPNFWLRARGVQIDVNKLVELQQKLTALATNQVADQSRALKLVFYKEIASGKASFESIDDKYARLKSALVSEALELVISSSVNSELTRGLAVGLAAQRGLLTVVQALLANGQISETDRGWAVRYAAQNGDLEVVKYLLANGASISRSYGSKAIREALAGEHHSVADFLKQNLGWSCSVM